MLSFTAAVLRSVHDESPTLLLLRECQLMLHGDSHSHSSSSKSVTRCFALRLLLRTARCVTSTQRLSSSLKLVVPSASAFRRSVAIDSCSRHQDHARGDIREGQGKRVPCVGLFTLLGVLRSYVVARVLALLRWMLSVAAVVRWLLLPRIRALPRSPGVPGDASLSLLLRGLCSLTRVSSGAAGQSALLVLFVLALTPASSTPATFPRELFATLITNRRRVLERRREALARGLLVRRVHPGSFCTLSARGLARNQSSRRSATPPLQGESTVCRFHRISVWHLHVLDHTLAIQSALRSFTLQQCSCRFMTISAGYVCDRASPVMLVVWALEQRASPSLPADSLGALNHSLRFHDHDLCHLVSACITKSTIELLGSSFRVRKCPGSWIRSI